MFNNRYRPGSKSKEINYREEEKKILDSVMAPDNYDKRIRPSGLNSTGEPKFPGFLSLFESLARALSVIRMFLDFFSLLGELRIQEIQN